MPVGCIAQRKFGFFLYDIYRRKSLVPSIIMIMTNFSVMIALGLTLLHFSLLLDVRDVFVVLHMRAAVRSHVQQSSITGVFLNYLLGLASCY